jgi:protocatechuate 3,4-dioxygenase beta subunit
MPKAKWLSVALCAITAWWTVKPCLAETPAKGTVSGRVLTAGGEPLRRATVVIEQVKYADGSSETVADATTGDNGEFSFSDLAPARYRLQAEKSGYVAGRFPRTKALVRLTSGDTIHDITLRLVPVCAVSGYVLDGNGDPLAKAVVRLLQYKYYSGGRRLKVAREAITDEHGEYRIGDLTPGRYYIVASYHSRISDVVCPPVYYPDVGSFDDAIPIRLSPNDEAPMKFVLLPGKPVRVRGSLTGWSGTVRVSLIPRGGVPFAQPLSVETSNGTFQFKSVLPGDYTVLAASESADEMLEGRTSITVGDHELTGVSVRLGMRMAHKRLWVSVDSGPRFAPTEDIVISLHPAIRSSEDSIIVAEDDLSDAPEISTRGGNPIDLPYPGPFVVSAERLLGDSYLESADFQGHGYWGPPMPGTEHLVVRLNSHGASVEGIVLDSTDHPISGAVVAAVPQHLPNDGVDQSRTTTTDQYGQFVLHGLANTMYDIYAWDDVPDGAFYDRDFLAEYADTAVGISIASGNHYQVKLHAASANEE